MIINISTPLDNCSNKKRKKILIKFKYYISVQRKNKKTYTYTLEWSLFFKFKNLKQKPQKSDLVYIKIGED